MEEEIVSNDPAPDAMPHSVLVVDDEMWIRLDIAEELRAHGLTVIEAAHAEEARKVLAAVRDIDVVITDVQMPGSMDGIALARFINAHRPATKVIVTKVIVMSGKWHPGRDGDAPIAAMLEKPFPPCKVVRLVEQLIGASA
jgi:DNA-binding NtrC family response regulator